MSQWLLTNGQIPVEPQGQVVIVESVRFHAANDCPGELQRFDRKTMKSQKQWNRIASKSALLNRPIFALNNYEPSMAEISVLYIIMIGRVWSTEFD